MIVVQQNLQKGLDEVGGTGQLPLKKNKNEILEWIKAIAIAVVLVVLIRWLLFKPFIVEGSSMKPNFHTRERVIINEILYDIRSPRRGEVIVFHVPSEGKDFIKRVSGVPGDYVKVEGDVVTINGEVVSEPYIKEAIDDAHNNNALYNNKNFPNEDFSDATVPKGYLFVMGDNRSDSKDSRMIGYVPLTDVVGRADLIFWPLDDIKIINYNR
ncbi:signal peptidase I [Paenibacillus sp. 19GGS1-52]|uniref:signal peptidase I n=1 Tax=Paenibacillus sp. 19GGS1-52 TaxID=2758563 RepID=UPI001EFAA7D5|nr:signal peptidase I [Paenibacillus sp. 19GGS1-52]ULO10322.1 signal peptidase I [Paenibacillus sp. 19GGS1-52]